MRRHSRGSFKPTNRIGVPALHRAGLLGHILIETIIFTASTEPDAKKGSHCPPRRAYKPCLPRSPENVMG